MAAAEADDHSASPGRDNLPEEIFSLLDTDLYKLTMQCVILKYFADVEVSYTFTNRTPHLKLNRAAFNWLEVQVQRLAEISLTDDELGYLKSTCPYLNQPYLRYLKDFQFRPSEHVQLALEPADHSDDTGHLHISVQGLWVETILYEVHLLALTSQAYFRFGDKDWTYDDQEDQAYRKAKVLLQRGCRFSEFGTRRRRDYRTQHLVLRGLCRAARDAAELGWRGQLLGTSNVHFAMQNGIAPVGTVAHEWIMGVAAITDDYEHANEIALRYWICSFGKGVLGIALTDTFGTPAFLRAFKLPAPQFVSSDLGANATIPSTAASGNRAVTVSLSEVDAPMHARMSSVPDRSAATSETYAQVFAGVRQDSGDPAGFIRMMRDFYRSQEIEDKKTIVFSDSLNIELCLEYMQKAEDYGFTATFGIGTYFTNDFVHTSSGTKSAPLNIVIKLSSAAGKPAIKLSDNMGKNTGDAATIRAVKRRLGYEEKSWKGGNEEARWATNESEAPQPTSVQA